MNMRYKVKYQQMSTNVIKSVKMNSNKNHTAKKSDFESKSKITSLKVI